MLVNRGSTWRERAAGLALGTVVIPALTLRTTNGQFGASLIALAVAALCALAAARFAPRPRGWLAPLGVLLVAAGSWLLLQISFPPTAWLVAAFLGIGAGLAVQAFCWRKSLPAGLAVAVVLAGLSLVSLDAALVLGVLAALLSALAGMERRLRAVRTPSGSGSSLANKTHPAASATLGIALLLGGSLTTAWVGSSTPKAAWFGNVVSHGPRDGNQVAITFDDGPNATYTLQIRDILDRYGVKATFFTVGKALDQRPDVSRALLDDGMLMGDHSYHHDSTSWLDPGYGEIPETQASFQRQLGVCPAFFRPPHGTHTPFMAHVASERGMTMITWDVSAGDWATTDGQLVAQRVLTQVKPGSIILLHDSIDGNVDADRSVILTALPLILDGLRAKGLQPVRLDQLLDKPAYVPCRPGG